MLVLSQRLISQAQEVSSVAMGKVFFYPIPLSILFEAEIAVYKIRQLKITY
jgi:hypothetical protein